MLKEKEKIEAKVIEDREKKLDNDKNNQGKEVVESV